MAEKKLIYIEKERIAVQKVTMSDMKQLANFPYKWNKKIQKSTPKHARWYAHMDLGIINRIIARRELAKINGIIIRSYKLSHNIPRNVLIPIKEICFSPSALNYTTLICQPYTVDMKENMYPAILKFTNNKPAGDSSVHGNLFYGRNGRILKGSAYFWKNHIGHFFYFEMVDNELVISRVERSNAAKPFDPNIDISIYKAKHVLELEAKREKEAKDYEWLKDNCPNKCPKSLTVFRRMKTLNSKNYKALKAFAFEHGKEI